MSHCDQDTMSLLALGESAPAYITEHIAGCSRCQAELAALQSVVHTARTELDGVIVQDGDGRDATEGTPVTRIPPPSRVWEAIAAATGVTTQARADVVIATSTSADPGVHPGLQSVPPSPDRQAGQVPAGQVPGGQAPGGPNGSTHARPLTIVAATADNDPEDVTEDELPGVPGAGQTPQTGQTPEPVQTQQAVRPTEPVQTPAPPGAPVASPRPAPRARTGAVPRQRRRRESGALAGIGAVALIIGLLGGYGISSYVQDRPPAAASPAVIAGAPLSGLALAPTAAGDASVVQTSSGRRLDVDVRRLSAPSGFYEVWLINPAITQMVSIGVLDGSTGEFTLPDGVDISQFPLVDISEQGFLGNGQHSGRSVLRGTLRA